MIVAEVQCIGLAGVRTLHNSDTREPPRDLSGPIPAPVGYDHDLELAIASLIEQR